MFTYPLRYDKGLVDGRYKIIRIEETTENKPYKTYFIYFLVDETVYVGYAYYTFPKMGIALAKPAKNQNVQSYEEEYVIIPSPTKARSRNKGKSGNRERERIVISESYSDELYSQDEAIARLKELKDDGLSMKVIKTKDQKIADYVRSLSKRKAIEQKKIEDINTAKLETVSTVQPSVYRPMPLVPYLQQFPEYAFNLSIDRNTLYILDDKRNLIEREVRHERGTHKTAAKTANSQTR